jgi:hypothetical protein
MKLAAGMLALALLGGGCEKGHDATFIALDSDFASFRGWTRVALGSDPLPGHPAGPRFGYLNRAAPKGATAYPVGTMIVKSIELVGSDAAEWDLFAMAKRGGNFNPEGAVGWEFFRLRIIGDTPHILTRGLSAIDPDDGGSGYFDGLSGAFVNMCNGCHGTAASGATDHVLSPLLQPGR